MRLLTTYNRQPTTKYNGFTLIELLVTMTIIVLMAVIAIPGFSKNQKLIDLQNKGDEVKAGLDGMYLKVLNPEQGVTRYYAKMTTGVAGKVEYGSWSGTDSVVYKTINVTSEQYLNVVPPWVDSNTIPPTDKRYLVCDKGKSYCCIKANYDSDCPVADKTTGSLFFTIFQNGVSGSKYPGFYIHSDPFRVVITEGTLP